MHPFAAMEELIAAVVAGAEIDLQDAIDVGCHG
jgi:hypothetical protein